MNEAVGIGADDHPADDVKGARARPEPLTPPLDDALCAGAQKRPLGALGARFGRMGRMTLCEKFPADFLGNFALDRGGGVRLAAITHASHAELGPDRPLVGPLVHELHQPGIVLRQVDHQPDQLVAAPASLLAEALALEPHHPARGRARRN
jgi:hypothetical protein